MRNFLIFFMVLGCLAGCIRKIDIQQGNIMTAEQARQLHVGMTALEVEHILGTPILLNTFNSHRVDYVYTFKPGNGTMSEKRITLIFIDGHLKRIDQDLYSQYLR